MEYPEEYELLSVFESEPLMLDSDVPFYYNKSTFKYRNLEEEFTFSITPSYQEISLIVKKDGFETANLNLQNINSLKILSDNKIEKRIMFSGKGYLLKVQLKPKFSIQLSQEKENYNLE